MIDKIRNFKNLSPAAKASLALLFANMVLKGLSLISGPIFTRIMPSYQYGIVSTFMSWQMMLSTIVTLNLGSGVFNNGMLEFREDRDTFQFSLAVTSIFSAIIFFLVYLVFHAPLDRLLGLSKELVYFLFLYFLLVPIYGYWSGRQRYEFKYKALTLITILMAVASLGLSLVAVLSVEPEHSASAKIITSEAPNVLVALFFFFYIGIKAKFRFKKKYITYALKFNIPLIPHYFSMYVLSSSDRIMISKMVNTSATAIYSVAYTVGMVINILWTSIEASLSPWIYEQIETGKKEAIRKRTFQIMVFFAFMCVLCALFAPEIIAILAPAEYYDGVYVIPSIAASAFFIAAYSIYMRVELFYKQTKFAMIATTITAGLNLLLNYVFILKYGFIAAGYTTLFCYLLLYILHYMNVKRRGYDDAFSNRKIMILAISVVLVSILLNFVYAYTIVRCIFIAIIILIGLVNRKRIISIIRGA